MKKQIIKRPFATHYFRLEADKHAHMIQQGAASTEQGAIRASIVRIFLGQYIKASIVDRRTGEPIYHIRHGAGGLQVRYAAGVEFKMYPEPKRLRRA